MRVPFVPPRGARAILPLLYLLLLPAAVGAAVVSKRQLEPGATAVLHNGTKLFLECRPNSVRNPETFSRRYLVEPAAWQKYRELGSGAIPYQELRVEARRALLLAVFPSDYVDEDGWHHVVSVAEGRSRENLSVLCMWFTGTQFTEDKIVRANDLRSRTLRKGQTLRFPRLLLLPPLRTPTPERMPKPKAPEPKAERELLVAANSGPAPATSDGVLTYQTDRHGQYAVYRLKKGEALYSSVVVRFTDYRGDASIKKAVNAIQRRSDIRDVRDIDAGSAVKIPVDMLANQYQPRGSAGRRHYEEVLREAERQKGVVRSPDLDGVVVVLDSGHGGHDPGTKDAEYGLYEDELAYDIACRIKRILETETSARVYMTLVDPDQGFRPTNATRFVHDQDEQLMTTPRYHSVDDDKSVILRWYLANDIYRKELARGTDWRNVVFSSIHCDAIYNKKVRGAMVYIPSAQRRPGAPTYHKSREGYTGAKYARYEEVQDQPYVTFTHSERMRDEAVSRNFAETLIDELGKQRVKRHLEGPNVRSEIHRHSRGKPVSFVPGVLRCNQIPTKVLVETANLNNPTDRKRLSDPVWRQSFAEGYVNALKTHYRAYEKRAQR